MFHDVGFDGGVGDRRSADRKFAFVGDKQNPIKRYGLARLGFDAIDFQGLTGSDTILFSTSF
jgi:hypothetical protein